MGARVINQSNNGKDEIVQDTNSSTGVGIEASDIIDELTRKIAQLTLDGIVKDVVIRKLEEQLYGKSIEMNNE